LSLPVQLMRALVVAKSMQVLVILLIF